MTGTAETADGLFHVFLWDGTTMRDLGTPGEGVAINASGQVTGFSLTAGGQRQAFLWNGTTLLDLGTLGGTVSEGVAINASGQVIGVSRTSEGRSRPFLSDGGATLQDLNVLIDPADPLQPFVTLNFGIDINDLGQILANGVDSRTGESHAYVVSPIVTVPESGTLALLGFGLLGLGVVRRRAA